MKYRCNTQGCAKFGVVYARPNWDGSEPIDCTLCGESCEHLGELGGTPEPVRVPTDPATIERIIDQLDSSVELTEKVVEVFEYVCGFIAEEDVLVSEVFLQSVARITWRL